MDRLELLVRDTLAEHAERAPTDLSAHRPVRARRIWLASAAAAAVAAVGITAVALGHAGSGPGHPRHVASSKLPASHVPAGYHLISYHGIEFAVPDKLPIQHFSCGWTASGVFADDPGDVVPCPMIPVKPHDPPPKISIEISPSSAQQFRLHWRAVTVHGMPAEIGYGPLGERRGHGGVLIIPSKGVTISVHGPSRQVVDTVLHSARPANTDRYGCVAHIASMAPTGNAPSDVLVPPGAKTATDCEYAKMPDSGGFWLIGSGRVSATTLPRLVRLLNSLPAAHPERPALNGPTTRLQFDYPDGVQRVLVLTRYEQPEPVTDGQHHVQDPRNRLDNLLPND